MASALLFGLRDRAMRRPGNAAGELRARVKLTDLLGRRTGLGSKGRWVVELMMKALVAALSLALVSAGAANAAEVLVDFTGTLTSQTNPGVDPAFAVGDTVQVSISFNDANAVQWGNSGYEVVGLYSTGGTPGLSFQITGPHGTSWSGVDDFFDGGDDVYTNIPGGGAAVQTISTPGLILLHGRPVGLFGLLDPATSAITPAMNLGSGIVPTTVLGGNVLGGGFGAITPSDVFDILQNNSYDNTAQTVGFGGIWNFTGATVQTLSPTPEPPTWLLMALGGAFLAGVAFLRQRFAGSSSA
jgi:hypothetical protein